MNSFEGGVHIDRIFALEVTLIFTGPLTRSSRRHALLSGRTIRQAVARSMQRMATALTARLRDNITLFLSTVQALFRRQRERLSPLALSRVAIQCVRLFRLT